MKRRFARLAVLAGCLLCPFEVLAGFGPAWEHAPVLPEGESFYVQDFAGLLNDVEEQTLRSRLQQLDKAEKAQVAVVTLERIPDDKVETASAISNRWGLGHDGKRNGIVVLVEARSVKTGNAPITIVGGQSTGYLTVEETQRLVGTAKADFAWDLTGPGIVAATIQLADLVDRSVAASAESSAPAVSTPEEGLRELLEGLKNSKGVEMTWEDGRTEMVPWSDPRAWGVVALAVVILLAVLVPILLIAGLPALFIGYLALWCPLQAALAAIRRDFGLHLRGRGDLLPVSADSPEEREKSA